MLQLRSTPFLAALLSNFGYIYFTLILFTVTTTHWFAKKFWGITQEQFRKKAEMS